MRWWWAALVGALLVAIVVVGFWQPAGLDDSGYLLTLVATIATLAGVGFAVYGWFAAKELPEMVRAQVRTEVERVEKELQLLAYRQQEAVQKIIAAYAVDDVGRKIALLEQAIAIYPAAYNAHVALGYAYWAKGDLTRAQESFLEDLRHHPDNFQAASDLAALYASQEEWLAALHWMKEAVRMHPATIQDFEADTRFAGLRAARRKDYDALVVESARITRG